MFNNLFMNEKIKIYNGTSHDVSIYEVDNENFQSNRSNSSFRLINPDIQPIMTIEQKNALNVKRYVPSTFNYTGISFGLPDFIYPVEQFQGYENYDVIIVSRFYAESAFKFNLSPDYIDRLYIVGTKILDESGELIGNCGLQKAARPLDISYYINAFETNQAPSLISAKSCLQYYKTMCLNIDFNIHNAITTLERHITLEETKRNNCYISHKPFEAVFNV